MTIYVYAYTKDRDGFLKECALAGECINIEEASVFVDTQKICFADQGIYFFAHKVPFAELVANLTTYNDLIEKTSQ